MKLDTEKLWYTKNIFSILLLPLSWLFKLLSNVRRFYYKKFNLDVGLSNICIVVVGNLTVGGAGKTPFVSWLAQRCKENNLQVGIISRGYGRSNEDALVEVSVDSKVDEVGDEALMLKQQTLCPVAVAADRCQAARFLMGKYQLDVILSDDGLQHYQLPRKFEIVVIDGERMFGNGWCLPAGPLREPVSRLKDADLVVSNGVNAAYKLLYTTEYEDLLSLNDNGLRKSITSLKEIKVHAVAGIGNPERFFSMLEKVGLKLITHAYPDHYAFKQHDLEFGDDLPIIMTEKDAVKCKDFKKQNAWYLPITIRANAELEERIDELLEDIN